MTTKVWTDEERIAFGQKMAAARAARKAEPTTVAEATEVVTEMAATAPAKKTYATSSDVPEGVRPIVLRQRQGERSAQEVGVEQAADTGYQSGGAAVVIESGEVLGAGGAAASAPVRQRIDPNGRSLPAQAASSAAQVRGGVLFSDKAPDGGTTSVMASRSRANGPAEPTGLPCSCVMPTILRGQDPKITWCVTCGGERDRVARPENALRGKSIKDIRSALAGDTAAIDYNAMAERVAELVIPTIIAEVIGILDDRAAQFASGEHSEVPKEL